MVYEFAVRQHIVQLLFPQEPTMPLEVRVSVQGAVPSWSPAPEMVERAVRDRGRIHGGVYLASVGGCPGLHIINLSGYTLIYIGMALAEEHCLVLMAWLC